MRKTVGKFTIDMEASIFEGPAAYMREQGNAKLDAILDGVDTVFNTVAHLSPDLETAILVAMQTDYAQWAGMKDVEAWLR